MHLPKSLNLDSTGDERSQMHHKEVTPTFPGSETSMAVGTISFITDDAGRGGGRGFKSEWRNKGDIKPNTVGESCLDPS